MKGLAMMTDQLTLNFNMNVSKKYEPDKYSAHEYLSFSETIDLGSMGFQGVANIMVRFHELARTIKEEIAAS